MTKGPVERTIRRGVALVVMLLCASCGASDEENGPGTPAQEADPTATEQSDTPVVELFAPGVVSTDAPEFAISFTASGDSLFFNRTPADRSRLDLLLSVRSGTEWREAVPYAPLVGVPAIDPFVSLDGRRLYFSSSLAGAGTAEGSFNLWAIPLGDDDSDPTPLPAPINSDSSDVFNSVSADGRMVFSSRRDGVRAVYERIGEATVVRLDIEPEGATSASNPAIHPNGDILVFAANVGDARPDLFVTCREEGTWSAARPLPEPINSDFTDFAPAFGPGYLYFSSERPGIVGPVPDSTRPPGDIYRTPVEPIEALCGATPR